MEELTIKKIYEKITQVSFNNIINKILKYYLYYYLNFIVVSFLVFLEVRIISFKDKN